MSWFQLTDIVFCRDLNKFGAVVMRHSKNSIWDTIGVTLEDGTDVLYSDAIRRHKPTSELTKVVRARIELRHVPLGERMTRFPEPS